MRLKIKICILKALLACDGQSMPEASLLAAVCLMLRPAEATENDFAVALNEVSNERYALGVTDDFTKERSWTLTKNGEHKARQLK